MQRLRLILLLLSLSVTAAQAQLVITEIMYNPPESGTDSLEFIEVYNNGNSTIDLTNWKLEFGASVFIVTGGAISPAQYVLFAVNAAAIQSNFGVTAIQWTGTGLGNNGATIRLSDAGGSLVDEVIYDDVAPWPTDPDGLGASLVLCDANADNSQAVNWRAANTPTGLNIAGIDVLANPGAASGCQGGNTLNANDDNFSVASGSSSGFNVLANDLLPNPITEISIVTPPTLGMAVVSPDNTIGYTASPTACSSDVLRYRVCDASGCDTATVNIDLICYPAYSIATVTTEDAATGVADSLNATVQLTGIVHGVNLRPVNNNLPALLFTIIDIFGNGIAVSSLVSNFGYTVNEGDLIQVRGTIGQFNGQTEIRPSQLGVLGSAAPVTPLVVVKPDESTESKLITINNLHLVDAAEWTTSTGTAGFNVRAVSDNNPNDTVQIRIDRDVELYDAAAPTDLFNLTGIGGQFDASSPYTSGYQIIPRYNPDLDPITRTHEADFSYAVRIAPNPASAQLTVQTTEAFDRIALVSATGRLVRSVQQPRLLEVLELSGVPAGVYFLQFQQADRFWATRFVKQ